MPSTTAKRGAGGPVARNKPSGLCLNRKDLRSVREVAVDLYSAECLYLRENELSKFDAEIKLNNLRVLDLSINEIGGSVDFLSRVPHIRHLYMTGNKIDTLMGISNISSLETLCLSDNAISSFAGLENLPHLRVLSLNFNNIASFEAFPTLPCLHTLNLVGNPITEIASYRSMAIAITPPELVSIDGNPVQEEERAAVEHLQGKLAHCIREGFVVEGENVDAAADQFLLKMQHNNDPNKVLQLCAMRIASSEDGSSALTEGIPVNLSLCMQDIRSYEQRATEIFYSRLVYPVVFKVSGEASEVFVVGSMNNWADPIELERCEEEGDIYFHTTLYLPAGDYEYRYIVDGVEKVSEGNRITSKYKQGFCNLYQVTKLESQDEDQGTILHIRWMRSGANGIFEVIEGENDLTYIPNTNDIRCCLRAEVLAYVNGDFSFLYYDISAPIAAAPPSCPHLEIKGNAVEGSVLVAEADYIGGVEGNSSLTWYRVKPSGEEVLVEQRDPWAGYRITKEDIDCRVRVEFTPVRNDWVAGEPKSAMTEVIAAGPPECESIKIIGELVEGSLLEVNVVYSGGEEGASCYQWLRKLDGSDDYIPIEGEQDTTYVPTVEDVGKCLAVEYTPINAQGQEGETCRCVLEKCIEAGAPMIHDLTISGVLQESHVLTLQFEYMGGHFGTHRVQWMRCDGGRSTTKIGQANSSSLLLTGSEVGRYIEVVVTPVRSDGVQGKPVRARTDGVIASADPVVKHLSVVGDPVPGEELELIVDYVGGKEGTPNIEWAVENPATEDFDVVATGKRRYLVKDTDQGKALKVTYTPVRDDGVAGEPISRLVHVGGGGQIGRSVHHVDPSTSERFHEEPVEESTCFREELVEDSTGFHVERVEESTCFREEPVEESTCFREEPVEESTCFREEPVEESTCFREELPRQSMDSQGNIRIIKDKQHHSDEDSDK